MSSQYEQSAGLFAQVASAPKGLRARMSASELAQTIEQLGQVRQRRADLDAHELGVVLDLRRRKVSWSSIGWLFGRTGFAMQKRYGGHVVD